MNYIFNFYVIKSIYSLIISSISFFFYNLLCYFLFQEIEKKESRRCEKIDENEGHFLKLNSTKLCAINTSLNSSEYKRPKRLYGKNIVLELS